MPGRSGKMTNEAHRQRGNRMVLTQGHHGNGNKFCVIFQEGQSCFSSGFTSGSFMMHDKAGDYISFRTLAKSYTLSYLLRIGRFN